MSFLSRPTTPVLATALALGLSPAAWAQSQPAKDAWEALNAFVEGTGGQLRADAVVTEGADIVARNAVLRSGDAPAAFTLNLGDVRVSPAGEGFDITPAPTFEAVLRDSTLGEVRSYSITHDGAFNLSLTEAQIGLGMAFGRLALAQTGATRRGNALEENLTIDLTGFNGTTTLTLAPPFTLDGRLVADVLAYTIASTETEFMPMRQSGTSSSERVSLTFSARGLELLDDSSGPGFIRRAFQAGFGAAVELVSGPTQGSVEQDFDGQQLSMSLRGGDSVARLTARNGVVAFETTVDGYTVDAAVPGMASGTVSLAGLTLGLSLPVISTPTEEVFGLRFNLRDLAVSDGLLAPLGASSFAGDTATLDFDLQARGRWLVEITDDPDPAEVPVDFGTITLANLLTRIGASSLTGSGSFTFAPNSFMRSPAPDGTGDFVFELVGGEALLNRLGTAGLLPPDQQFLARMMMNGLGRPVGADHLRSEVAIRPGGAVTVNGAPLPF
jgi:hypothetical protein